MDGIDYLGIADMLYMLRSRQLSPGARAYAEQVKARRDSIDEGKKKFFSLRGGETPEYAELKNHLKSGKAPSQYFEKHMGWMFGSFVLPRHRDAFLWAVDHCLDRPYQAGLFRRPLRSSHYVDYLPVILNIVRQFSGTALIDADICDILSGHLSAEAKAFSREMVRGYCAEIIAYELNRGNERLPALLAASINGDEGAETVNRPIILGILLSGHQELQEHLGRLLLAARLQEGLRQAICECADEGTLQGFENLLKVIAENNLIRYSSVKRAVGVWTGLVAEEMSDLERISDKTLTLLIRGLKTPDSWEELPQTEDSMALYMALWTEAIRNVNAAVGHAKALILGGSRHQALVCGFFARIVQNDGYFCALSKAALEKWPQDTEILAMFLPGLCSAGEIQDFGQYAKEGRAVSCAAYFDSETEARRYQDILREQYLAMKEKETSFFPCVFPWLRVTLRKGDLAKDLCHLAVMLGDDASLDEAVGLLPQVPWEGYARQRCLEALLSHPARKAQRDALMGALKDKAEPCRKAAFSIAEELPADQLDIPVIEGHLRLKAADIRTNCVKLLLKQRDEGVLASTERLLGDEKEQKRSAGYDLILQIAQDKEKAALKPACAMLLSRLEPQGEKEKILWNSAMQAVGGRQDAAPERLFTDGDAYVPDISFAEADGAYRNAFLRYFPDSALFSGKGGILPKLKNALAGKGDCPTCVQARQDFLSLQSLMDLHKDASIGVDPGNGQEQLLGYGSLLPPSAYTVLGRPFPLADLWESWYATIGSPERLARLTVLLCASAPAPTSAFDSLIEEVFGVGFSRLENTRYFRSMLHISAFLTERHGDARLFCRAAMALACWIALSAPKDMPVVKTGEKRFFYFTHMSSITFLLTGLCSGPEDMWKECFQAREAVEQRFLREYGPVLMKETNRNSFNWAVWSAQANALSYLATQAFTGRYTFAPGPWDYIKARHLGVIGEKALLYEMFQPERIQESWSLLSSVSLYALLQQGEVQFAVGRGWQRRYMANVRQTVEGLFHQKGGFSAEDNALAQYACQLYERLLPVILRSEISRGEAPAAYTDAIPGIRYIRGAEWLCVLLAALGTESLNRENWYWNRQAMSRQESLCHLLGVCIPGPEDNAEAFRATALRYRISDQRLVDAAMYNPAWAEIIGGYLGWPDFVSAVYYFIAHMNERFDEGRQAVIARYTPLTPDELNTGAFDVNWFRSAYQAIGEERFNMLYASAKYISDGAKHSRARRYADAALGKLDLNETEAQLSAKRNKDLLMAYAIIPVRDDVDVLRRFLFIQQFVKESRSFGAQRIASEKRAADMALVNLAANSKDGDVTRLTLRMETKLTENNMPLFQKRPVEDVYACLAFDAREGLRVVCEKDGKELKSVPSRLKKDAYIQTLINAKKELTEQYRRTRRFLEDAMTDGLYLSKAELKDLRKNPIARPLVDALIFKAGEQFGMPAEEGLADASGVLLPWSQVASVQIAHPLQLFQAKAWPAWQEYIFRNQIVQPFKQAFRELYVKTADELGKDISQRYAGYQIQPRKAAAALKTRRWTADMEAGLQKVFYQENIAAYIFAKTDWFTPADIEAPALEGVGFFERVTGKSLKIDDVPDVVFSEVMRDVDLAVSVAYVGGVDPEASHSTVEMRSALLGFTLPLFGLTNVRVEKNHAVIQGKLASYTVHLGSGVVHQLGGAMLQIVPVHSQHRGRLFLPFVDDDPKTAEILTKILFLAEDFRIQDPYITAQISARRCCNIKKMEGKSMKPIILGYATGKGLDQMTREDALRLTHINVAFGLIENGLLSMKNLPRLKEQLARVREMNPAVKIVLSIGGWTAGGFSLMSRTAAGREAFAQSVKAVLDDYQLDGVDIDWEYPCSDEAGIDCDPSDRENFTFLMQAMRGAAGPERIVSIAAGGGDYFVRDTEMDKVAQICDYVQIMTYDLNCFTHTTRHHTSLYAMEGSYPQGNGDYCARIFEKAGVPREKMVLGVAFYSRKWTGVQADCHGLLQEAESIGGYGPSYGELLRDYIGKNGFVRYWDGRAKAPWLFDGSTFITFEDAQSILEKCAYVKEKGLLGLMYWEHSCDPTGTLLKTLAEGLQ